MSSPKVHVTMNRPTDERSSKKETAEPALAPPNRLPSPTTKTSGRNFTAVTLLLRSLWYARRVDRKTLAEVPAKEPTLGVETIFPYI